MKQIGRKNSKFSKIGEDDGDSKNFHRSHFGDSKMNDDIVGYCKRKHKGSNQIARQLIKFNAVMKFKISYFL